MKNICRVLGITAITSCLGIAPMRGQGIGDAGQLDAGKIRHDPICNHDRRCMLVQKLYSFATAARYQQRIISVAERLFYELAINS